MCSTVTKESQSDIRMEQSDIDGISVGGLAYGVHLTLFLECVHRLVTKPSEGKIKWHLVAFVLANFALGTVEFGTSVKFNEMVFVDDTGFPGGPLRFSFSSNYGDWQNLASIATPLVMTWLADSLMIFRLFIFWRKSWCVIAFPAVLLTAFIVLLVLSAHPNEAYWSYRAISFGTPCWILTTSINFYTTSFILGRIWFWRRSIQRTLQPGPSESKSDPSSLLPLFKYLGKKIRGNTEQQQRTGDLSSTHIEGKALYTSVVAMLVEGFALSAGAGTLYIGAYVAKADFQNYVRSAYSQIVAIAPLLLILRVARGTAWSQRKVHELTEICFTPSTTEHEVRLSNGYREGQEG